MPCTTILVGKNASYDGSTLVARNEDSSNGVFEPKRMRVVHPDEQPRVYTSVLSHLTVELPDNPMRYTSVPDVVPGHGIWPRPVSTSSMLACPQPRRSPPMSAFAAPTRSWTTCRQG